MIYGGRVGLPKGSIINDRKIETKIKMSNCFKCGKKFVVAVGLASVTITPAAHLLCEACHYEEQPHIEVRSADSTNNPLLDGRINAVTMDTSGSVLASPSPSPEVLDESDT